MTNPIDPAAAGTSISTDFVLASTQPYSASNMRRARGNKRRRFFPGGEKYYRDMPWATGEARIQVENLLTRRRRSWVLIGVMLLLYILTDVLMRSWYPENNILFWSLAGVYLSAFFGFFYAMYQEMAVQWALDEMVDNLPAGWDEGEEQTEDENESEDGVGSSYEAPETSSSSPHELT